MTLSHTHRSSPLQNSCTIFHQHYCVAKYRCVHAEHKDVNCLAVSASPVKIRASQQDWAPLLITVWLIMLSQKCTLCAGNITVNMWQMILLLMYCPVLRFFTLNTYSTRVHWCVLSCHFWFYIHIWLQVETCLIKTLIRVGWSVLYILIQRLDRAEQAFYHNTVLFWVYGWRSEQNTNLRYCYFPQRNHNAERIRVSSKMPVSCDGEKDILKSSLLHWWRFSPFLSHTPICLKLPKSSP